MHGRFSIIILGCAPDLPPKYTPITWAKYCVLKYRLVLTAGKVSDMVLCSIPYTVM